MKLKFCFVLSLAATVSLAGPIIGTTSCRVDIPEASGPRTVSTTQPTLCSLPLGDPANHTVSAAASGDFVLATTASNFSALTLSTSTSTPYVTTTVPSGLRVAYSLFANAFVSDDVILATGGSPRPGWLEYQASYLGTSSAARYYNPTAAEVTLGSVEFDPRPFPSSSRGPLIVPWTLGSNFTLSAYAESIGLQFGVDELVSTSANLSIQFRFFEADRVTPVLVIPTPEPSSISLCAMVLSAAVAVRMARRSFVTRER